MAGDGERRTIVVAGAGIGGLTAALALAAVGYRIVIVERADQLSVVGAGIQIAPNAGRILASLGLEDAFAAAAIEPEALEIRSAASGRVLTRLPAALFRERYGFPYRVIHRADLQRVLVEAVAASPKITLMLGATIAATLPGDDGVAVRVDGPAGADEVIAAAVIGADGVRSTLRADVRRDSAPVPTGRTAWRALVPAEAVAGLLPMKRTGLWLGPDAHIVHYPVQGGTAVSIVVLVAERWDEPGWNVPGERGELLARFANASAGVKNLLSAAESWQKFALMTVDGSQSWCKGRLALLGDAAHAMMPFLAQGAAMAIEDAAVLADCLDGASDVPAALGAYEAARKPRVIRVAEASRRTGTDYHWQGPMAFARDAALTLAGTRLILDRADWIYRWRAPERKAAITR